MSSLHVLLISTFNFPDRNLVASQEAEHLFCWSSCMEPTIKESRLKILICTQNKAYSGKIKPTADLIWKVYSWRRKDDRTHQTETENCLCSHYWIWWKSKERKVNRDADLTCLLFLVWFACLFVFFSCCLGFMLAQSVMWVFELSLQFVPVFAKTLVWLCESGDFFKPFVMYRSGLSVKRNCL